MQPFAEFDCPEDGLCSNQGTCDDVVGLCICNEGFEGNICKGEKTRSNFIFLIKSPICPLSLLEVSCPGIQNRCNENGFCDLTNGVCTCDEEYQGLDCSGNNANDS